MKISQQPTDHILVKAGTDSEWDSCDFAIISCGKDWAERMGKRVDAVRHFPDDGSFFSSRWFDGSASFYVAQEQDMNGMLPKGWAFVELEEGEEEEFNTPESRLDFHTLVLWKDGSGRYAADGKHTCEEFYTEDLPLATIIESMAQSLKS